MRSETRDDAPSSQARELIEAVRSQTQKRCPSWSDIDAVERALLTLRSGEEMRRFGWALRAEFRRATGVVPADQLLLKAYETSQPPALDTPNEDSLRADLLRLQGQLQELYANRRLQLRARNLIAFWTVLLFVVGTIITLQLDKILGVPDTIFFDVFGVGLLGGLFSKLLRVQKFKLGGIRETTALSEAGNRASVILSPGIGGVGALVLFVVLSAGLLKGSFLPQLAEVPFGKEADGLEDLFQVQLASSVEAAKLYLLCFLAGFSERLVPDVMSRLAAMAEKAWPDSWSMLGATPRRFCSARPNSFGRGGRVSSKPGEIREQLRPAWQSRRGSPAAGHCQRVRQ
jgi:hypothetical protein